MAKIVPLSIQQEKDRLGSRTKNALQFDENTLSHHQNTDGINGVAHNDQWKKSKEQPKQGQNQGDGANLLNQPGPLFRYSFDEPSSSSKEEMSSS